MGTTDEHQAHPPIFLAYPSRPPLLREALHRSATLIQQATGLQVLPWERLQVGGRVVITQVLEAIDSAELAVFELTDLNLNVLFELGYAIARAKRVWLLRDTSLVDGERAWQHMKMLLPVGYSTYASSDDIRTAFLKERPDQEQTTIYDRYIDQTLTAGTGPYVLHARSAHSDDADRALSRRTSQIAQGGIRRVTIDPQESPVEPLAWYAQHVSAASAVVVHFASPRQRDAGTFNRRYALLAGLAAGFETPTLLVAEDDDLVAPFDYQDRLYTYSSSQRLAEYADSWLTKALEPALADLALGQHHLEAKARVGELRNLNLGEHLAENEEEALPEYFVETAEFGAVLRGGTVIFEGRKGTGKTANLLSAAKRLGEDRRNLVCVLRPVSYELDGVLALVERLGDAARGGYVLESLWKFLIYSEIAIAAADQIKQRPTYTLREGTPEWDYLSYVEGPGRVFLQDFSLRLEAVLERLSGVGPGDTLARERGAVAEALHDGPLRELRRLLGSVLSDRTRVAVLIDNLDKSWHRDARLDNLALFLLGLLESVTSISREFAKGAGWRQPVPVTLGVFIRSDILTRVRRVAREPDKMPIAALQWTPELLRRVVEERYQASQEIELPGDEFWRRFFCAGIGVLATREFVTARTLPRPRDILYYCKAAVDAAINARHILVEPADLLAADRAYSQFAFEALLIEAESLVNGDYDPEEILFELAGGSPVMSDGVVNDAMTRAGVGAERIEEVIAILRALGVLGVEVRAEEFDFSDSPEGRKRADALAKRHVERTGLARRFAVRSAYCPYLGIDEERLSQSLAAAVSRPSEGSLF